MPFKRYTFIANLVLAFVLLFCLVLPCNTWAQIIKGTITDARTGQPLPFATIKYGATGQGELTDVNGKFPIDPAGNTGYIDISYLGYETKRIGITEAGKELTISLRPVEHSLGEVVVRSPQEKLHRIINHAIANRALNNPDKYDWYRCHIYYKMAADIMLADTAQKKDTLAKTRSIKEFTDNKHLLMSETYSVRSLRRPRQLQEDVVASRLSGFKDALFTSLVTDVLPFHAYNDYITINGKDYHNPLSKGFSQRYHFTLADELQQGRDTVWIISFRPKQQANDVLTGTVYINSNGYAIAYLLANANTKDLGLSVRLEQEYQYLNIGNTNDAGKWFPKELNYILNWNLQTKSKKDTVNYVIHMKGNSKIDSVTFTEDRDFRFDKAHTVKVHPMINGQSDSAWQYLRGAPLDNKETGTYRFMDSIGEKMHFDNIAGYLKKLPEGKLPAGVFDIDLKRLFNLNPYESVRLGLGLQTNEKLIKWLSVGGWAGYGFRDAQWKYGGFAEAYLDRYKEFVVRAGYTHDIQDPGRIHINRDLDKNYLSLYLLQRVDRADAWTASVSKKMGYWNAEISGRHEEFTPLYHYALSYEGTQHTTFSATEASLNIRYAFAERSAPLFGSYYSMGTRYPVWYGKVTEGRLQSGSMDVPYTQALSAVLYNKHINRIGNEHFLVEGGKIWNDAPLPLSKLFAGNGYRYDKGSLYTFGGLLTMYPYEYYSDQFVSFMWRHDFDWRLYNFTIPETNGSSAPYISLQYDFLYGTLNYRDAHQYTDFSVPDKGYSEGGLLLNNILRIKYVNLYYLTLNVGYFYHITPTPDLKKNGKYVIGAGIDL